ncbi:MAG: hypothetical protein LBR11_12185 [Deltaproteobacteria bacterium]|jgi:hypothetical protein|nr:hypothetical protein [Deltaproteobacteria bacterium]
MNPERDDDDRLPGDDTFDIDIEGFEEINFHDQGPMEETLAKSQAMDLELEALIQRLDKVVADPTVIVEPSESPEPPESLESLSQRSPAPIPRPPAPPRPPVPQVPQVPPAPQAAPAPPVPEPQAEAEAILLTDRLPSEGPPAPRPPQSVPAEPAVVSVSQLTAQELAALIERAVERGVRRALASRQRPS